MPTRATIIGLDLPLVKVYCLETTMNSLRLLLYFSSPDLYKAIKLVQYYRSDLKYNFNFFNF